MPGGRPTDFKEEYCDMLIEHMSNGYSLKSFGGLIGVCEKTLHNWKKDYPQFLQSLNIATGKNAMFWEDLGIRGVRGQIEGFSASTWIFNMKNRHGWTDKTETELSTSKDEDKKLIIEFKKRD
jgi:transposase